jgi:hypothetical protein
MAGSMYNLQYGSSTTTVTAVTGRRPGPVMVVIAVVVTAYCSSTEANAGLMRRERPRSSPPSGRAMANRL